MEKIIAVLGVFAFLTLIVLFVGALAAFPTKWIVNYVFTDDLLLYVFGGPLSAWKALWLNFLCGMLFKTSVSRSES